MQYYRINYRRNRNWIDYKIVKAELGTTDAITKTKLNLSKITEVFEITKEEYEHYKQLQKERKEREKANRQNSFIAY